MSFFRWIFTHRVTWAAWQFGVLKWSLLTLGIALGAVFAEFLGPYLWLVGLVFVLTAVWTAVMYFQGMNKSP